MIARWAVAAALVPAALALGAQKQSSYAIGGNVQVSQAFPHVQHYETQVAADPENAAHLLVGAYIVNADQSIDTVFYVSFDAGSTWKQTLHVPVGVDPAVAIGLHGVAFAGTINDVPRGDGKSDSFLVVHRSADGGRTWEAVSIAAESRSIDRDYITIDETRRRVYVHGYLQDPRDQADNRAPSTFVFYTSLDGGKTFGQRIDRQGAGPVTPKFAPANGVVTPDGAFVALAALLDATKLNMLKGRSDAASAPDLDGSLVLFRSTDGGRTLDEATQLVEVRYDWRVPQLSMAGLAVDRSTGRFKGRLYAVWPEARVDRRTQIFIASSDDGGHIWTAPHLVNDDRPSERDQAPNHFMPAVAVNLNGVVGVSWYDRRDNADNLGYWPRFAASLDGGVTFLPSERVSTSANLVLDAKEARLNSGDTAGLAADAKGVFHPVWIDNRTGTRQIWTTPVVVRGRVR